MNKNSTINKLLSDAVILARKYRAITGKPLGITGEVAEFSAAKLLNLELTAARTAGYDALWKTGKTLKRVQIKGRCLPKGVTQGRLGRIQLEKVWDSVLLVLLNEDLEPLSIYEAGRAAIRKALLRPGSKARNERGALPINVFKRIGKKVWPK